MANPQRLTYFVVTRKIFDSEIWRDNPHVLKLFIYLIGKARNSKNPKKYPGFDIKRGELVTSLTELANNNEYLERNIPKKWSKQRVGRMLKRLQDNGYID